MPTNQPPAKPAGTPGRFDGEANSQCNLIESALSSHERPDGAKHTGRAWMKWTLILAGLYNLGFGAFVIFFPNAFFQWTAMDLPRYPELWQCIGMIVGVYGIGYLIAAADPVRHWPIVLVGFLGKLFGPIGFVQAVLKGSLPLAFGLANVTNDLVWLVPFALILLHAYQTHRGAGKDKRS